MSNCIILLLVLLFGEISVILILDSVYVAFSPEKNRSIRKPHLPPSVLNYHTGAPWSRFIFSWGPNHVMDHGCLAAHQLTSFQSGKSSFELFQWFFPIFSVLFSQLLTRSSNVLICILHFCIFLVYFLGESLNFVLQSFFEAFSLSLMPWISGVWFIMSVTLSYYNILFLFNGF